MKLLLSCFSLIALFSLSAVASTDPRQVDGIDTAREGNLSQLALTYFKDKLRVACDDNQVLKFDIIKIASDSANSEKVPGTPYEYTGTYLVVQKCLYGSTYVGAYSDTIKSSIVKGSFHSKYNKKNGPAKMEDLKFEYVKDIDLSRPAN